MTAPVIAITDVTHRYGDTTVLDLPRLVIPPGTSALLGPNGAGKTTLLRLLATVSTAQTGSILVDGVDLADPDGRLSVRRRLGFAMQDDRLPERMRVAEFCDYVAALKELTPRRRRSRWTNWVLHEVGLAEVAAQRISSLSGGMRRRLMMAQALLGHPDVLILDEPLVSLDAEHRSRSVRSIAASADRRTTVVATHHADELGAICRHVIVLFGGRLAFAGPPDELAAQATGRVFESPVPIDHPSTRALGPDRFRVVDVTPPEGRPVEPTVHDGYLAVLRDVSVTAG